MRLTRSRKQAIIDGYLNETGNNMFVAAEFIDWLGDQKDHEAYPWFFGQSDEVEARNRRIDMARSFVSGLRVVVKSGSDANRKTVSIVERTYPAYISPTDGRSYGGGYIEFNPADPSHRRNLRAEGAKALTSWLERYGEVFDDTDLTVIEEISSAQMADRVVAA